MLPYDAVVAADASVTCADVCVTYGFRCGAAPLDCRGGARARARARASAGGVARAWCAPFAHLLMQDFADLVEHCEILRPFQQIAKIAKVIHEKVLSESEYQAVRKGAYLVDLEEAVTMQWSARQVFQPLYGSTPALGSST